MNEDIKAISRRCAHFLRYRDGRAVEHWSVRDDMTLMRQLGVIPDREPSAAAAAG